MYETTKTHNAEFRAFDRQERRMIYHRQAFIPAMVTNLGVFRLDHTLKEDRWELLDYPPERFTLMQYAGQNDSDNTKIYEMDRVEVLKDQQLFRGWVQLGPYLQPGKNIGDKPTQCFGFYVDAEAKDYIKNGKKLVPRHLHQCSLSEFDMVHVIGHYFD